jgi:hypothetical protein
LVLCLTLLQSNSSIMSTFMNFLFICSNIQAAPTYGAYISQLIRYSRAFGSFHDFLDRGLLLTKKLLNQGFIVFKWKSSLRKFYSRNHHLRSICASNGHGYVPLVVITIRFFPHLGACRGRDRSWIYKYMCNKCLSPLKL